MAASRGKGRDTPAETPAARQGARVLTVREVMEALAKASPDAPVAVAVRQGERRVLGDVVGLVKASGEYEIGRGEADTVFLFAAGRP